MVQETEEVRNEEWFLGQLEAEPINIQELKAWLCSTHAAGRKELASSSAELLQDTLVEKELKDEALDVLRLRATWKPRDAAFRKACERKVLDILGSTPEVRALVQNVGFDADIPLPECLRRLEVLQGLAPNILCYDSTWGAGVVRNIDWFYKRVDIDFEKKSEHQMSFAYAGETLDILSDDHLLAMRHNDPEGLQELVASDPAEVVRICLRSFGDQPIARIQELLVPAIFEEAAWKKFWDGARKVLKKDPLIDIPGKRSEPVRLLAKEKGYDEEWFATLSRERGMKKLLDDIDELIAAGEADEMDDDARAIVADRLAFVIKGAERKHLDWEGRAVMTACDLKLDGERVDVTAHLERYLEPQVFLTTSAALPAREVGRFLVRLKSHAPARLLELLLEVLPLMQMTVLNESMDLLMAEGREMECAAIMRDLTVESETADVEVLYWLMRHPEYLGKWSLGGLPELALWCIRALNLEHVGEKLKTQNQLRNRFEQKSWLEPVLDAMDAPTQRELMRGVKDCTAWGTMEHRSVLAVMIKHVPALQAVLSARSEPRAAVPSGPITSFRSYQERQEALEKIIRVEIPEVSKEIGIARAHGDLRENAEYKAAKDKQALLMRRRAEFEALLQTVRPTAFENVSADVVAPGTQVTLEYGDGSREIFQILGAWDRDEELEIISCESKMAQTLQGKRVGDEAVVPTTEGEAPCTIAAIDELPPAVRDWINA